MSEINRITNRLGYLWCDYMHNSPMWPIHGQYECRICGRRRSVPWAGREEAVPSDAPAFANVTVHFAPEI